MGFTYGFYNSLNGDRKYNAIELSSIFDGIIKDGVFATVGNAFQVVPGSGMSIAVKSGRAWFNHTWSNLDNDLVLSLTQADLILPRIDSVIIEINSTETVRANSIKILTGIPATVPVAPTLINTTNVHQYALAHISVPVGLTIPAVANITYLVGKSLCPFITGILETIDTTILVAQWMNQFNTWFSNLQNQLDSNQAANLQNQIDHLPPKAVTAEIDIADKTLAIDTKYVTPKALLGSRMIPVLKPVNIGDIPVSTFDYDDPSSLKWALSTIGGRLADVKILTFAGSLLDYIGMSTGCRYLLIEMLGAGGGGGGAAVSSATSSVGSGGGAGEYTWHLLKLNSNQVYNKVTFAYNIGLPGYGGQGAVVGTAGGDTIFQFKNVYDGGQIALAKGGAVGATLAAAAAVGVVPGAQGGLASASLGLVKTDGSDGGYGLRLSASVGMSGAGAAGPFGGLTAGRNTIGAGADASVPGGGGAGAWTNGAVQNGGNGAPGWIRVSEYI